MVFEAQCKLQRLPDKTHASLEETSIPIILNKFLLLQFPTYRLDRACKKKTLKVSSIHYLAAFYDKKLLTCPRC